jgi:CRISPR/Cas system-associated exonuclease Cas4 (RecB family)
VGDVKVDTLSYSSIQRHGYVYEDKKYGCEWSYWLRYIKGIKPTYVDSKYGKFGQIIHDIFANFYPSIITGNINNYPSPKNYFDVILTDLLSKKWDYTLSETMYNEGIAILANFSINETNKYLASMRGEIEFMPLHIELALDEPYNIRIDKILPDHSFMDYKTATEMPESIQIEHILQAGIYAISYFKKFGIWSPKMVYYFVRHNKPLIVPITQEIITITTDIANHVTDNINKGTFTKNSDNCHWCDERHVCGLEEVRLI